MDYSAEINRLTTEIDDCQDRILDIRGEPDAPREEQILAKAGKQRNVPEMKLAMRQRRILRGHFGKIYAMHWAQDSKRVVSASQDGKLIIWNAESTNKINAISLKSSWVMTCAFSEDDASSMVACGGLDNVCTVYRRVSDPDTRPDDSIELAHHEGYLSCCRFIGNRRIVTTSGDSTAVLWDLETKQNMHTFNDHTGDVMSVSISGDVFVTGSCDATAKLWDFRTRACLKTFPGHESDLNSVHMFANGKAFGTGSDDSSCRVFDISAYRQLHRYADDKILCGITSVDFSSSGRVLFAGYDDFNALAWDTVHGIRVCDQLPHENRVSCLGVPKDGTALCTGSWDSHLRVFA